jgi:CubicO group peptidase (beta-lactamase class C family)
MKIFYSIDSPRGEGNKRGVTCLPHSLSRCLRGFPALLLLVAAACFRPPPPAVPGREWKSIPPEQAGFSGEKLSAVTRRTGGSGVIVHNARLVYEWGDSFFSNDAASATKVIYTHLILQALREGRIQDLDEEILPWLEPELFGEEPEVRGITFRHLLNQTSGYGLEEGPGEAFAYNDRATGLLTHLIFRRLFAPLQDDALVNGEALRLPLGLEHTLTVTHPNGPRGRFRISARDFARFGWIYAGGGVSGRRRILDPERFAEVFDGALPAEFPRTSGVEVEIPAEIHSIGGGRNEKDHLGCLGSYWWKNRRTPDGQRLLPAAPPDTRLGLGYGGRFGLAVMPSDQLVIVWFDVHRGENWSPFPEHGRFRVNALISDILSARTGP